MKINHNVCLEEKRGQERTGKDRKVQEMIGKDRKGQETTEEDRKGNAHVDELAGRGWLYTQTEEIG